MSNTSHVTRYVTIYTNPITGNMVIGESGGPPIKKFKKGQEAAAQEFAKNWKPDDNQHAN